MNSEKSDNVNPTGTSLTKSETELIKWFSDHFDGGGLETTESFGALTHYCVSFSNHSLSGHGNDPDRNRSVLKAVCEFLERKEMRSAFEKEFVIAMRIGDSTRPAEQIKLPPFQNSNGWAVHFEQDQAIKNAYEEAIERHVLTASYLISGWAAFSLINRSSFNGIEVLSLVSKYECRGLRAGLVVLNVPDFPGVILGHICESTDLLLKTPRWAHALFEAVFVYQRISKLDLSRPYDSATSRIIERLTKDWNEPIFSNYSAEATSLVDPDPYVSIDNLRGKLGLPVDFYAAFVFGGGLVPLCFTTPESSAEIQYFQDALKRSDISVNFQIEDVPTL